MTSHEQIIFTGRDLEFSIYLQDAAGAAINITGQQYRFRLYVTPGAAPAVDLPHGAGSAIGSGAAGRIDINGGTLGSLDPAYATGELTRTDSGADVIASWAIRLVRFGTAVDPFTDALVIRQASSLIIKAVNAPAGPAGPGGAAGASSLVTSILPYLYNGGFDLWGLGTGGFGAVSEMVAEGWRFTRGAGSTHAIARASGLSLETAYCAQWNRSVTGSGTSTLAFALDDARRFHAKDLTLAWEDQGSAAIAYLPRLRWEFGTGGSAAVIVNGTVKTAGTGIGQKSMGFAARDLGADTIGTGSWVEVQFARRTVDDDGILKLGRVRLYVGSVDYGYLRPEPGDQAIRAKRRWQAINTRTVNGTTRVYFPVPMRAAPAITASLGTISNITAESCDLTHGSAAATVLKCDAEF